jgi:hypothetical protein
MEQEDKNRNTFYAIPCRMDDEDDDEYMFFLTFNTRNEKEALRLASCVCGEESKRSLVVITDNGDYYDCY